MVFFLIASYALYLNLSLNELEQFSIPCWLWLQFVKPRLNLTHCVRGAPLLHYRALRFAAYWATVCIPSLHDGLVEASRLWCPRRCMTVIAVHMHWEILLCGLDIYVVYKWILVNNTLQPCCLREDVFLAMHLTMACPDFLVLVDRQIFFGHGHVRLLPD